MAENMANRSMRMYGDEKRKKNAKNVNVEFESWLAKSNNIQHIY